MMIIPETIAMEMVENHITLVIVIFIIEKKDFDHFKDNFALKWLILIILMHGVIEKIEFNGAQLKSLYNTSQSINATHHHTTGTTSSSTIPPQLGRIVVPGTC